jgi:hypothetical protein
MIFIFNLKNMRNFINKYNKLEDKLGKFLVDSLYNLIFKSNSNNNKL